jgi:hypothetical protein
MYRVSTHTKKDTHTQSNFHIQVLFLTEVHANTSVEDLQAGLLRLQQVGGSRSQQMRALLSQHFSQFCTCKETIDIIKDFLIEESNPNNQNCTFHVFSTCYKYFVSYHFYISSHKRLEATKYKTSKRLCEFVRISLGKKKRK